MPNISGAWAYSRVAAKISPFPFIYLDSRHKVFLHLNTIELISHVDYIFVLKFYFLFSLIKDALGFHTTDNETNSIYKHNIQRRVLNERMKERLGWTWKRHTFMTK